MTIYAAAIKVSGVIKLDEKRIDDRALTSAISANYKAMRAADVLTLATLKGGVYSDPPFQLFAIEVV